MSTSVSNFSTVTPQQLGKVNLCKVLVSLLGLQHWSAAEVSHYKPAEQLERNNGLNCSRSFKQGSTYINVVVSAVTP